jgi:uncharacterized protein YecT (DUF1311 family)
MGSSKLFLTALALPAAAAGLALAQPGAVLATATAPKLQPPLVTEKFSHPGPCNQGSTIGQGYCGERAVLAADKQLNADIKVVFGLLYSQTAKKDFITAEADWATYRQADCTSQSDVYLGGTEQGVVYVYCLATQDGARRGDLKAVYKLFSQGIPKPPRFP